MLTSPTEDGTSARHPLTDSLSELFCMGGSGPQSKRSCTSRVGAFIPTNSGEGPKEDNHQLMIPESMSNLPTLEPLSQRRSNEELAS